MIVNIKDIQEAARAEETIQLLKRVVFSNANQMMDPELKLNITGTPKLILTEKEFSVVLRALYDEAVETLIKLNVEF